MIIFSLNRHMWLVATPWAALLQGISAHKLLNVVLTCSPAPGLLHTPSPHKSTLPPRPNGRSLSHPKAVPVLASCLKCPSSPSTKLPEDLVPFHFLRATLPNSTPTWPIPLPTQWASPSLGFSASAATHSLSQTRHLLYVILTEWWEFWDQSLFVPVIFANTCAINTCWVHY